MSLVLKFRYRFESAHRFTSSAAPSCRTPHGHTWYATAVFKMGSESLDGAAMAAEFSVVKSAWKRFITETVDHSFLHNISDPLIPFLIATTPDARLLPFPADPTTELVAGLFALKLKAMHDASKISAVSPSAVFIQETPTNSIHFRFEKDGSAPAWLKKYERSKQAWWMSADPTARGLA